MKDRPSSVIRAAILDGIDDARSGNAAKPNLWHLHLLEIEPIEAAAAFGPLAD